MKVLTINCGSSSLRVNFFEARGRATDISGLASAHVRQLGHEGILEWKLTGEPSKRESLSIPHHQSAIELIISRLRESGLFDETATLTVGHRIVHGGETFTRPVKLNNEVVESLTKLGELAPLHNQSSLAVIQATRRILGTTIPMVAVFDTAFHQTLPNYAKEYAIPADLTRKYAIRRHGFHGLAHRSMSEQVGALLAPSKESSRLITLQLGNGCSAAAIKNGVSIDTSMGFTPLEGLMMGTRSGDLDPSLVAFLSAQENVSTAEVIDWLNRGSGLLGVSDRSSDMRELLELESQGDSRAHLALEMFCYRIQKCIGSYLTVLGGADAIVFGGGIGENAPSIRARICSGMKWCNLFLDENLNETAVGSEGRISNKNSSIEAYVIKPNEAEVIAVDTIQCLDLEQ